MSTVFETRVVEAAESMPPCADGGSVAVSIVMPCLNEERTVATCVRKAIDSLRRLGVSGEVVVSDNGSSDDSVRLAEAAGARVVHCSARGYGAAIQHGVTHSSGKYVVVGDADDSYDFADIEHFVSELEHGSDMVLGNRFRGKILQGAMPWKNRYLGNPILTGILNLFFRTGVGDAHCGLRSFTRDSYNRMQLESDGMEFASEMVVKAAKLRLRVTEVPITYSPDGRGGDGPKLRPWRDGWRHLKFLLMFSPLHLFVVPGTLLLVIGLALLLLLAAGPVQLGKLRLDIHWMVLGSLLTLMGTQIVHFGICARLYMSTHRFPQSEPMLQRLRTWWSVETGIIAGGLLFLCGFCVDAWIMTEWWANDFGALDRVRPALLATTLMATGIQTLFFSFFVGILDNSKVRLRNRSGS